MSTKEQAIHDDQESSPKSQSKGQAGNPSTFAFDVALSTAVAANGKRKATASVPNEMVNFQSGLLGVSETSSDMRDLLEHEERDTRAAEAVALFCHQVKKWIGAFAAALGGLDTLVFAGGIGENAPTVRVRICDGLRFLGIELDDKRNTANERAISSDASRVVVHMIRTDEELMIAKTVCQVLGLDLASEKSATKGSLG